MLIPFDEIALVDTTFYPYENSYFYNSVYYIIDEIPIYSSY